MKYEITTYENYLNLSLHDLEIISENFEDYTMTELGLMDAYNSQFKCDLNNAVKFNSQNTLLTDEQFYNWPQRKIIEFFSGKIKF